MAIQSIQSLKDAIAGQIETAYSQSVGSLRYQPSEDESTDLPYVAGMELPIIYTEWKLDFDLASNITLFKSERDQHIEDGVSFPHCWMIDVGGLSSVQSVYGSGEKAKEREITLKIWFLYGYYPQSCDKFTGYLMSVSDQINDNLIDLGVADPTGLLEADPLVFPYPAIDKMDFDEDVVWLAQGTQKFRLLF